MYMLQLFDAADEIEPIEARTIRDGLLRIGRDSAADWPITDPDGTVSRAHCELEVQGDGLRLRSLGANGTYDDATGARYPDAVEVDIALPAMLRMGRFRLKASHAPRDPDAAPAPPQRTIVMTQPLGATTAIPDDWTDATAVPATGTGSLLEAFCAGAGLDASLLSSEEPAEVMRRAGAIYRQMVLGIADLMNERERARSRYKLTRTTIASIANNPFKWAPTQRLAIDLLLAGSGNFLSGPAALQASFRDIKLHLIATFAGLQGTLRAAIHSFAPAAIDAAIGTRTTLLKRRAALQVEQVAACHADLVSQLETGGGTLERAFIAAYDEAEANPDDGEPRPR